MEPVNNNRKTTMPYVPGFVSICDLLFAAEIILEKRQNEKILKFINSHAVRQFLTNSDNLFKFDWKRMKEYFNDNPLALNIMRLMDQALAEKYALLSAEERKKHPYEPLIFTAEEWKNVEGLRTMIERSSLLEINNDGKTEKRQLDNLTPQDLLNIYSEVVRDTDNLVSGDMQRLKECGWPVVRYVDEGGQLKPEAQWTEQHEYQNPYLQKNAPRGNDYAGRDGGFAQELEDNKTCCNSRCAVM